MNNETYRPPILDDLPNGMGPKDEVACASCPYSLWQLTDRNQISCFCSALHEVTWFDGIEQFTAKCDGREQALAERTLKRKGFAA